MKLTAAQQKYFAYWLTRSLSYDSIGKFTASLQDAQVNRTPHLIHETLFVFKSLLSKSAILADEVEYKKNCATLTLKSSAARVKRLRALMKACICNRPIAGYTKKRSEKRLNLYLAHDNVDSQKEE